MRYERYWVYNFMEAAEQRSLGTEQHPERLEHYSFERYPDGSCALEVQVGWPGGYGHCDGAGNSFELPREWFALSWEEFLDRLTEKYPAEDYGYSKEELIGMDGLRRFLGFD